MSTGKTKDLNAMENTKLFPNKLQSKRQRPLQLRLGLETHILHTIPRRICVSNYGPSQLHL